MDDSTISTTNYFVGQRIRQGRKRAGLTQQTLGDRIGVSYQQLQKYENGKDRIAVDRLSQIAGALGVPEQWFFGPSVFPWPDD